MLGLENWSFLFKNIDTCVKYLDAKFKSSIQSVSEFPAPKFPTIFGKRTWLQITQIPDSFEIINSRKTVFFLKFIIIFDNINWLWWLFCDQRLLLKNRFLNFQKMVLYWVDFIWKFRNLLTVFDKITQIPDHFSENGVTNYGRELRKVWTCISELSPHYDAFNFHQLFDVIFASMNLEGRESVVIIHRKILKRVVRKDPADLTFGPVFFSWLPHVNE